MTAVGLLLVVFATSVATVVGYGIGLLIGDVLARRRVGARAAAERVRVARVQHQAERQIRAVTNAALAEMLSAARTTATTSPSPSSPTSSSSWPDGEWRMP